MLYINFEVIKELEEDGHDPFPLISVLTAINQGNKSFLEGLKDVAEYNFTFKDKSLVKHVKGRKNDTWFDTVRLDKAGKELLKDLTEAEVSEDDIKIFDWLSNHYKKIGKEIGNGAKTKRHIRDFRIKSGIVKNNLIRLCYAFVSDESQMEYSHKLEYIFYKPKTVFETRFNLEESRLYQYYMKNKEQFDKVFTEDGV